MKFNSIFLLFFLSQLFISAPLAIGKTVSICDDAAEWPPYAYYERENGVINKTKLTGATYDLVKEVFKIVGLEYTYVLLPWRRCLEEVFQFGVNKEYEIFVNASYNEERAQKAYASVPLYKSFNGMFYSLKAFPNGPGIKDAKDLNQFNLCGVHGYNYKPYFDAGVKKEIDTGGKDNKINLEKLVLRRCDFFLSIIEPIYGGQAVGQYKLPSEIVGAPVPGAKDFTFYLWISKQSPRAYELLTKINQAIIQLQENGTAEKIFLKYLPNGSGL